MRTFIFYIFTFLALLFVAVAPVSAQTKSLAVSPAKILQGDPFMVQVNGVVGTSTIKKITFAGAPSGVLLYQNKPTIFFGVNLNQKPGTYNLIVTFTNGTTLKKNITVGARYKPVEALGIPASLGGNTTASDDAMVAALVSENATLTNLQTASTTLWTQKFIPPLATKLVVTDPYGYSRQTGVYQIPHKGVDYKAAVGTPVMAINSGIVRVVTAYEDYGNTIVIDHGLGIMSFYLHLSQMNVKVGDTVTQGQVIGLSGQTGYADGPHLHLSVRINTISIDPVKFLALFK